MEIIKQSVFMSLQNIKANKMRAFLTTLGIIIGVASVIAILTIVNSGTSKIEASFNSMGASELGIKIWENPVKAGLSELEIEDLSKIEGVIGIAPTVTVVGKAAKDNDVESVSIEGKSDVYYKNTDKISQGRPLKYSDMDGYTNVCVLDADAASHFFSGSNPVGEKILLNGQNYLIVGVEQKDTGLLAQMQDMFSKNKNVGVIRIPYKNALRIQGKAYVTDANVYLADSSISASVKKDIENQLSSIFPSSEDDLTYFVQSGEQAAKEMANTTNMMSALAAGIASISLLVGGIGIMNMMLVSVTERTKEIGLRKALGAEPIRIQMQFLIESVVLSLVGGNIGIALGIGISYIALLIMNIPYIFQGSAVVLGFFFAMLIGIIFGWFPAKKASELNPIDALRAD